MNPLHEWKRPGGRHLIDGTDMGRSIGGDHARIMVQQREVKIFDVYCASQIQPPKLNPYDSDELTGQGKMQDQFMQTHFGPSFLGSYQRILFENTENFGTGFIRTYVHNLKDVDTHQGVEDRDHLEWWFRDKLRGHNAARADQVPKGDLMAVTDLWLQAQFFHNVPKAIQDERRKLYDAVRNNVKYFRRKLRGNPETAWLDEHLREHLKIGKICAYDGQIYWRF